MKTLGEVLTLSTKYLTDHKIQRPRRTVEELLCHLLKVDRVSLYMQFERPMEETELVDLRALLTRSAKKEPLEYILGYVDFYHCRLKVGKDVLIPRQETELLLERIIAILKPLSLKDKQCWDVCCGSGCLGIGLKKTFAELSMSFSDISSNALSLAQKNAEANAISAEFFQGDLLKPFAGKKADIILCNPPYISEEEMKGLDESVIAYEPRGALVSGKTGWEFYERLVFELPQHLNPNGKVFFEIGYTQGKKMLELFSSPQWKNKYIEKDLAGHDRFFFLEIE